MAFTEQRSGGFRSDMGYRETDRSQIVEANMKFLTPQESGELFRVMNRINHDKIPMLSLPKPDLYILFHGHIFTNTVRMDGSKPISDEDMAIYSEIMSSCYALKYNDIEVFLFQFPRGLDVEKFKEFGMKADRFRDILSRFEKLMGHRDKM